MIAAGLSELELDAVADDPFDASELKMPSSELDEPLELDELDELDECELWWRELLLLLLELSLLELSLLELLLLLLLKRPP